LLFKRYSIPLPLNEILSDHGIGWDKANSEIKIIIPNVMTRTNCTIKG
jgi:hypothetical protein